MGSAELPPELGLMLPEPADASYPTNSNAPPHASPSVGRQTVGSQLFAGMRATAPLEQSSDIGLFHSVAT